MPLIAMPYPDLTVYLKPRLPPRQTKSLLFTVQPLTAGVPAGSSSTDWLAGKVHAPLPNQPYRTDTFGHPLQL